MMSAQAPNNEEQLQPTTSGLAVTALVFGLLVFCLGPLAGLPAMIFGVIALMNVSGSEGPKKGIGMAAAGLMLGLSSIPLTYLFLSAVQKVRVTANRSESMGHLTQMTLGMNDYADEHQDQIPPVSFRGEDHLPAGKGNGLSWRVAILPYIEQRNLYKKFHLDEPWDSEHNNQLLDQMPPTYQRPGDGASTTETPYRVFVGNGAVFSWGKPSATLTLITTSGGTSNTILIVETRETVPWTKPDELEFDPNGPLPLLGRESIERWWMGGGKVTTFPAGFADYSIKVIAKDVSPSELSKAITVADDGCPDLSD